MKYCIRNQHAGFCLLEASKLELPSLKVYIDAKMASETLIEDLKLMIKKNSGSLNFDDPGVASETPSEDFSSGEVPHADPPKFGMI